MFSIIGGYLLHVKIKKQRRSNDCAVGKGIPQFLSIGKSPKVPPYPQAIDFINLLCLGFFAAALDKTNSFSYKGFS